MRANVMVLLQGYIDKYNRIAQIHPSKFLQIHISANVLVGSMVVCNHRLRLIQTLIRLWKFSLNFS